MRKDDLVALCRKLRIDTSGTKDELLARIRQEEAKTSKKKKARKEDEHPDLTVWKEIFLLYAGKLRFPPAAVYKWQSARVALCPPLWLALFWSVPPSEGEIFEASGIHGHLTRAMRDRWRVLTGASQDDIDLLTSHFVNLYQMITATHLRVTGGVTADVVIETWATRNWRLMVEPVVKLCRQLQAAKVRSAGMIALADKLDARSIIPLEDFSADVVALVEKSLEKDQARGGGGGGGGAGGGRGGGGGGGSNPATFKCFKCKKRFPIPPGMTKKAAITDHRKKC